MSSAHFSRRTVLCSFTKLASIGGAVGSALNSVGAVASQGSDQAPSATTIWAEIAKLSGRKWISPEEFANGDHLDVDASSAFDRMLSIDGPRSGKNIRLNAAQYRFSRPLVIHGRNIVIVGAGFGNTSLVAAHNQGPCLFYDGEGDSLFADFSLKRDSPRGQVNNEPYSGFVSDPGRNKTTLRLTLMNIFSQGHTGDGIEIINSELALMSGCGAAHNLRHGVQMAGRDLNNIENRVERSRFSNNGECGLSVKNLSYGSFEQVECINNIGVCQFLLSGSHNRIVQPDLEAFNVPLDSNDRWALSVSESNNLIERANIFKCMNGIKLISAPSTRIDSPDIKGTEKMWVDVGILVDVSSPNSLILTPKFSSVKTPVSRQPVVKISNM